MFADLIYEKIEKSGNPTALGLDPRVEYIPDSIREKAGNDADSVLLFNERLIDILSDIIPVVKFQSAYYELLGPAGIAVLQKSMAYAKGRGMVVILDAKRNDIGSTAAAYAGAYLSDGHFAADALTVNAYLGSDGVRPFIDACKCYGKGIFILVKTSNPSSHEIQDLKLSDGMTVFEKMAEMVNGWGDGLVGSHGYNSVGAVAGATYPDELKRLRNAMPASFLLVPGYGTQGGGAADVANGFDENGNGAVVNSSRGIMCAWESDRLKGIFSHERFAEAARDEAIHMKNALSAAIGKENIKGE
ncbi:MAG: orotidine-5'-phosphate decarboxylase [Clostridia bacterium]|nr:orotidine-5'-phosphate decarboxylase [Clostridia bacterium]